MITLVVIHQQKQLFALILSVLQREVVNSIIEYGSSYSICRDAWHGKKWWPIRTYGKYAHAHCNYTPRRKKYIYFRLWIILSHSFSRGNGASNTLLGDMHVEC